MEDHKPPRDKAVPAPALMTAAQRPGDKKLIAAHTRRFSVSAMDDGPFNPLSEAG